MQIQNSWHNEIWSQLDDFPNYSVSNWGRVRRDDYNRLLALSLNQQGNVMVAFLKDRTQYRRSVATLVADHFLGDEKHEPFTTPTHQDGDKTNNYFGNLFWRPRWFTVKYHRQFENGFPPQINRPIINHTTGQVFPNSAEAAIHHVILERDLVNKGISQNEPVFPDWNIFSIHTKVDIY